MPEDKKQLEDIVKELKELNVQLKLQNLITLRHTLEKEYGKEASHSIIIGEYRWLMSIVRQLPK